MTVKIVRCVSEHRFFDSASFEQELLCGPNAYAVFNCKPWFSS